ERRLVDLGHRAQRAFELADLEALALAGEEVLEPTAPQAPDARLAAGAGLPEQRARFLEVVADETVVAAERGDGEVAPFAVGHLAAGGGVDGLHDAPVLVDVGARQPAARAASCGAPTRTPTTGRGASRC